MKQKDPSYIELANEIISYFPQINKGNHLLIAELIEANLNGDLYLPIKDADSIDQFDESFPFYIETIGNERRLYFQKTYKEKIHFEEKVKSLILTNKENEKKTNFEIERIESIISELESQFKNPLAKEQKQAVIESIISSLRIIAGGPGTGKTTVVSFILKVLDTLKKLPNTNRIALVAPTGRAAQRLTESLQKNLSHFQNTKELTSSLRGQTIHNLLKFFPETKNVYYGEKRYLPFDLIIMDETSMVDMMLMNLFLDSVSEKTHLILLGDPNQLPSVGQGEVLADLLTEFKKQKNFVSELKTNHRSSASSEFSKFAELVKTSFDSSNTNTSFPHPKILTSLGQNPNDDFIWLQKETPKPKDVMPFKDWKGEELIQFLWKDFFLPTAIVSTTLHWKKEDLLENDHKETLEKIISDYRCLSILRNGYYGIEALQSRILELAKKQLTSSHTNPQNIEYRHLAKSFYFEGMPIIIKRNDPTRKLFNGDIGLVLKIDSELRAVFSIENRLYSFALDTLPEHEPAFFLTIHKSQGSEYNTVLLYLPPINSFDSIDTKEVPILNRRILYTAVTRAKKRVILLGNFETWILGLTTFQKRNTGVRLTSIL
ncbi:exodeoxyribonuclease V subunit alpha [Leptospira sp. 2 VSF19]|uniref:RecBCD enzyme subunit RecD n=1 Tax=Leptospira soteropolitanensis TaxID=2950025 RepID=A0AAW5VGU0_9LEPT|nr:exodeoxyribonuclease V subunit alpha [Leptospira soteropolitanensis]MCW7492513.1 exodeoxyribonuclease V subunit alpha [Leptospira soteropolitanensis]MCW7500562.1 exodeoxyribonuclease V subunit alpha [Leptospira soteropolitanensis]MCW7522768.1 exodeoxyribonuclease V subunit alpha [Leptospira soteropolitanensis]MCW7526625.1 exodeoxyribonuclease V subunit alpha [Leptospira soteropolitanensis]MCW7530532.1 exodeoxyribonuclease V subunit alpha [Leptospira soteropolitanensis]